MKDLALPNTEDKRIIFTAIQAHLDKLGITIGGTDFDRPWGGFFVIGDDSIPAFISEFFPEYSYEEIANGLPLTPKILVFSPGAALSWQYHYRRKEIWKIIHGPLGIVFGANDDQGEIMPKQVGEIVEWDAQIRHRGCGLETFGVAAEFWVHTDPNSPSDEDDIVRLADDFQRD